MKYNYVRILFLGAMLIVLALSAVGCSYIPGYYWVFHPTLKDVNLIGKTRQDVINLILPMENFQYDRLGFRTSENYAVICHTNIPPYHGGRIDRPLVYYHSDYNYLDTDDGSTKAEQLQKVAKLKAERAKYWIVFPRRINFPSRTVAFAWCLKFDENDRVVSQTQVDLDPGK